MKAPAWQRVLLLLVLVPASWAVVAGVAYLLGRTVIGWL